MKTPPNPFDDRPRRAAPTPSAPPRLRSDDAENARSLDETRRELQNLRRELKNSGENVENVPISDDGASNGGAKKASSWLLSVVLHIALTIILALIVLPLPSAPTEVEAIFSEQLGDQLETLTDDEGSLNPTPGENYKLTVPEDLKIEDVILFEEEELPFVQDVAAPFFERSRIETSDLLGGRTDPGTKNDLIAKYGGNQTTRDAVAAGLKWLAKQQRRDGSWSFCGPYSDGVRNESSDNPVAATAFALLAFQGDGSTRESGEYSRVVKRGWSWLLKQQRKDGSFRAADPTNSQSLFYAHSMTTIALCEILALEKKENVALRRQARLAVAFLLDTQNEELGGWKYEPGIGSDLSVSGWALMALQTARVAKLDVPESNLNRVSAFLDSVSFDDGARYAYQRDAGGRLQQKTASMTAAGLLCREFLGWTPDNPALQRGAEYLTRPENLVAFPEPKPVGAANAAFDEDSEDDETPTAATQIDVNVYGWYAASTALKQLGPYNKYWRRWNAAMSSELPKRQEPKDSKEAGSWPPQDDVYGFSGGRLYVTTLSILCLEVYYRHLSLYN